MGSKQLRKRALVEREGERARRRTRNIQLGAGLAAILLLAVSVAAYRTVFQKSGAAASSPSSPGGRPLPPPGSIDSTPIADLPDYPGSARLSFQRVDANSMKTELLTSEPVPTVAEFYRNALHAGGWIIGKTSVTDAKAQWVAGKGDVNVIVGVEKRDDGTHVTLERAAPEKERTE